jgi:hypothetical protein
MPILGCSYHVSHAAVLLATPQVDFPICNDISESGGDPTDPTSSVPRLGGMLEFESRHRIHSLDMTGSSDFLFCGVVARAPFSCRTTTCSLSIRTPRMRSVHPCLYKHTALGMILTDLSTNAYELPSPTMPWSSYDPPICERPPLRTGV